MMTLRQINDVCKRGYRYDIEHDRFISEKEDYELWFEQYGPRPSILTREQILAAIRAVQTVLERRREKREKGLV